ncbi:hypothetical protein KEM55_000064, partial [Ascosphaera atra]
MSVVLDSMWALHAVAPGPIPHRPPQEPDGHGSAGAGGSGEIILQRQQQPKSLSRVTKQEHDLQQPQFQKATQSAPNRTWTWTSL